MTYTFVIDRKRPDLFTSMREHFADDPEIVVILERRRNDRRRQKSAGPVNRCSRDRRAVPAGTWATLGYAPVLTSGAERLGGLDAAAGEPRRPAVESARRHGCGLNRALPSWARPVLVGAVAAATATLAVMVVIALGQ
jgi:hypothetical protein